ncbi:MAG: NAD(P)-dependent oxidoreductase [Polyangiaceae bacterium]
MASPSNSSRLFVVGATGGIGKAVVAQALERGHGVTAFVRSPGKLDAARDGLTVLQGNPLDAEALRAVLPGHDAVVSALGPPGPGATTVAADGARSMVAAMQAVGMRRLLAVGVAVLFEDMGLVASILRHTLLRNVAKDSAEMERILRASDLEWTVARPPRLTNGPRTGRYAVADDRMPPGSGGASVMRRADVAHFLLEELEHPAHVLRLVGMVATKGKAPLTRDGARISSRTQ